MFLQPTPSECLFYCGSSKTLGERIRFNVKTVVVVTVNNNIIDDETPMMRRTSFTLIKT